MIGRNPRDALHQARSFGQAHHAQPKRHHSDQPERDGHRGLRAIESACCYFIQPIIPAANRNRQDEEREPDVIQHNFL